MPKRSSGKYRGKVEKAFGFRVLTGDRNGLTPEELSMADTLEESVRQQALAQELDISEWKIYVNLFTVSAAPSYNKVGPINQRISILKLKLNINDSQKGRIAFLNQQLGIGISEGHEGILVKPRLHEMKYEISGSYIAENPRYLDYLVTMVHSAVPSKDRKLSLMLKGIPTSSYSALAGKLSNTYSKIGEVFLTSDIQVALF